jgi:hypothetical protein
MFAALCGLVATLVIFRARRAEPVMHPA